MPDLRLRLRVLLPLVLASACASAATPAPQSEVLVVDENGVVMRHIVDENARVSVEATPDRIWQALVGTFTELGIQPTENDRAHWKYGNMGFIMPTQFHRQARSDFLHCSTGAAGLATNGRMVAQVYSQLIPMSATTTTLVTHVSALLRSNEGTSTATSPVSCASTGVLEEYVRKEVERRLLTIP